MKIIRPYPWPTEFIVLLKMSSGVINSEGDKSVVCSSNTSINYTAYEYGTITVGWEYHLYFKALFTSMEILLDLWV